MNDAKTNLISMGLTDEQADAVLAAYDLTRKAPQSDELRIVVETYHYNDRRHGRPWIAKVTEWSNGKPALEFGDFHGPSGDPGSLEIMARPGDIIRQGQKDHRRPSRSDNDWFVVASDGTLEPTTEANAREHWVTTH